MRKTLLIIRLHFVNLKELTIEDKYFYKIAARGSCIMFVKCIS